MPRVSTPLYLFAIIIGVGLSTVLTVWSLTDRHVTELLAFSWLPLLPAVVAICVLQYKCWAAIQNGYARTSPAVAVGLCFVPFFNLYWLFQVWYGFAVDYNRYIDRHRLFVPQLPAGLYLSYCVFVLLSFVPFVTLVASPVSLVLLLFVVYYSCQAINRLADVEAEPGRSRRPQSATTSTGRVLALVAAILLALTGVALVGLFVSPALESRRLWLYQQDQVEKQHREMKDLEQRQDPASQIRLRQLREDVRKWHPESYRDEYYWKMLVVGTGIICLVGAGAMLLIRWVVGRGHRPVLSDP